MPSPRSKTMLIDTHFHLDFITDLDKRALFVRESTQLGVQVVAQTVLPSHFARDIDLYTPGGPLEGAVPSLGFHPWWIDGWERELDIFAEMVGRTRHIGEIGLDFSPRRLETVPQHVQVAVLRRVLDTVSDAAASTSEPYVLSIHAVRSASAVLDLLEGCPALPVFHWFSGTSDELTRLIRMGGAISVNPRMLETKRGRAYAKQVPADRLYLETDLGAITAKEHYEVLAQLDGDLRLLRGMSNFGLGSHPLQ